MPCRYSHVALASIFQIRQQRVMAILALKGMEHGDIAINPGKTTSSQATSAATGACTDPATADPSHEDSPGPEAQAPDASSASQDAASNSDKPLDSRAQIVQEAMDDAAKDIPRYLKWISRQSASWQFDPQAGLSKEQKTDNNIVLAWLKALVKDPFWVRPDKDDRGSESVPDTSVTLEEDAQDAKLAAKADQEQEQQLLQDIHQESQRSSAPEDEYEDSNDPKVEGVERHLLSNPDYLPYLMEHELWDCHEPHGTGERHVKFIPRYPKFEVRSHLLNTTDIRQHCTCGPPAMVLTMASFQKVILQNGVT